MPDNAFYYRVAYATIAALFLGYTIVLILRRRALERRRERQLGGRS